MIKKWIQGSVLLSFCCLSGIGAAMAGSKKNSMTVNWDVFLSRVPAVSELNGNNVVIVDAFDTPASTVKEFHARKMKVFCYINAGSYENWRVDAASFPAVLLGSAYDGWAGEQWLDIRNMKLLLPIINKRLSMCKAKGFDGVDFDNMAGYENNTGFPLTRKDQLKYDIALAVAAHHKGLKVGLKNAPDLAKFLAGYFDWAVTEQCLLEGWCSKYDSFYRRGKPVFAIEYDAAACQKPRPKGVNVILKDLGLGQIKKPC